MPAEQLAQIFEVLEGGAQVAGEVVQFPTDVAAASGGLAGEGVTTLVQMGNGAAAEVSQLTVIEGGAATTTGVGLLAMDVGIAGAAIAPALGLAVGYAAGNALYELDPQFWADVSESLVSAGQTVGGKVRAFLDGATKTAGFSQQTIEIFKNAFLEAGLFDVGPSQASIPEDLKSQFTYLYGVTDPFIYRHNKSVVIKYGTNWSQEFWAGSADYYVFTVAGTDGSIGVAVMTYAQMASGYPSATVYDKTITNTGQQNTTTFSMNYSGQVYYNSLRYAYRYWHTYFNSSNPTTDLTPNTSNRTWGSLGSAIEILAKDITLALAMGLGIDDTGYIQPGATPPTEDPFNQTYVDWNPITIGNLNIYPTELPVNNPTPDQSQAQDPDPDPDPSPWLEWLIENLPLPVPDPNIQPQPVPEPDPDPEPDPEPLPEDDPAEVPPDPPDPNPDPPDPPIPVVPVLPTTVDSNAMFTVYAPSISQLNSFGSWLWTSSVVEAILRMWQNPLDGIIAFMKVYAVPTTGTSRHIQVGYLDSEVSAPVVTSQFVTVDCGSVSVNESKGNATDYTPYVSLHLYLPFIGIVELDPDEFMGGSINVKYSIDVYTGTCLAEVKCTRSIDMPNATILYTFSGNASQQLPLTSANFAGALSSLVSAVGGGIMIASGGAVGGIAGAAALGHSLTHEMVHVGHSGALSSNAGIMASRKPYLIISRRHGYDANNYASEYGYPANKSVYLGNCSGYTRVKAGHLKCKADAAEKEEIMALLEKGVIL